MATRSSLSKSSLSFCPKSPRSPGHVSRFCPLPQFKKTTQNSHLQSACSARIATLSLRVWCFCPSLNSKDQNLRPQGSCSVQKTMVHRTMCGASAPVFSSKDQKIRVVVVNKCDVLFKRCSPLRYVWRFCSCPHSKDQKHDLQESRPFGNIHQASKISAFRASLFIKPQSIAVTGCVLFRNRVRYPLRLSFSICNSNDVRTVQCLVFLLLITDQILIFLCRAPLSSIPKYQIL